MMPASIFLTFFFVELLYEMTGPLLPYLQIKTKQKKKQKKTVFKKEAKRSVGKKIVIRSLVVIVLGFRNGQ